MKSDCKTSFLVICKILGMFFNRSTADVQYSLFNRYNLMQPIPLQLSRKQNLLLNSSEHFSNLDDLHMLCISEITDCERHSKVSV